MRKVLIAAGGVIGVIILIVAALIGYAYFNLNSIIASQRARLLARVSDAVGRPLEADEIKASLSRGVAIEITGVKLADDPAFSQLPFVQADDILLKVEFWPLLGKELKVTELVLRQPQIRIIRGATGAMNVSTIGKKSGENNRPKPGGGSSWSGGGLGSGNAGGSPGAAAVSIKTLTIEGGRIFYLDQQTAAAPVTINAINLKIQNFGLASPFDIALELAAFGDHKNVEVSGTAGPIMQNGAIDTGAIQIDLETTVGPLALAQLKAVPQLAKALPRALTFTDAAELKTKISGTVDALHFEAASDLTPNRVIYAPGFDKPAGTPLIFTASGTRTDDRLTVQEVNLTLANLKAKITRIAIAAGTVTARVDTNRFDIAPVAGMIAAARPYGPTGAAEVHTVVSLGGKQPRFNGQVTLANVNTAASGGKAPPVSDFNGTIRLVGNVANLGPLTFKLGSGHAQLQASADSLQPLHASYRLNVDKITLAELVPSRQNEGDENLLQVAAAGVVSNSGGAISGSTKLSAVSGTIANVAFTQLALDASYDGDRVNVNALKLGAFEGAIEAVGLATLGDASSFDVRVNTQNVNLQQALASQHAKAAETIRGNLTATVQLAGQGKGFAQIKPTLRGSGRAKMDNGKLIGVNVVAQALKKVDNVPGIGALVPAAVVANHPELFQSPDTDIQAASLTFTIAGPRITSPDIVVVSPDYSIFGDGWFDMDKNLDVKAKIKMSKAFSDELVAARKNVVYITNGEGVVEIPLIGAGQLPHPKVAPDLTVIAQRAATHEVQNRVGGLIEKNGVGRILKKNGLGGLLGGLTGDNSGGGDPNGGSGNPPPDNGSGPGGSGNSGSIPNPFKGLFH
jgi:uncharacterized protein involved in outer membrane biogenesis